MTLEELKALRQQKEEELAQWHRTRELYEKEMGRYIVASGFLKQFCWEVRNSQITTYALEASYKEKQLKPLGINGDDEWFVAPGVRIHFYNGQIFLQLHSEENLRQFVIDHQLTVDTSTIDRILAKLTTERDSFHKIKQLLRRE